MKEAIFGGSCVIAGAILLMAGGGYFGVVLLIFGMALGLYGVLRNNNKGDEDYFRRNWNCHRAIARCYDRVPCV